MRTTNRGRARNKSLRKNGGQRAIRALRNRLAEAQNWRCCYCGIVLEPETATIEHVQPLAYGGAHDWLNMAAACAPCNAGKGREAQQHRLMALNDFSKLRLSDGRISYRLYRQDGSMQPMDCADTPSNRLFVSWAQKFDRYTIGGGS